MIRTSLIGAALLMFASVAAAQEVAPTQCPMLSSAIFEQPTPGRARRELEALERLAAVNSAARQGPATAGFVHARQLYAYAHGAIYELYANPSFVSAILLEPGEVLNEVAAGDTSRWMVQETHAESEIDARTVLLVKPQASGIRTNIVLVTDRRTYTIEAIAQAGPYSPQIAWCYSESAEAQSGAPSIDQLNFGYRIRATRGRPPAWLPTHVFDDGRRTWIEMPDEAASSDLPPLFVITGEGAELVNYRVQGQRYMIDRLFDVAELRLGTRAPTIVRIEREGADEPRRRRFGARR